VRGVALWGAAPSASNASSNEVLVRRLRDRSSAASRPPALRFRARQQSQVASECKAFLTGQAHQLGLLAPPAWVWVNTLAQELR
jgi:hypothetical protein